MPVNESFSSALQFFFHTEERNGLWRAQKLFQRKYELFRCTLTRYGGVSTTHHMNFLYQQSENLYNSEPFFLLIFQSEVVFEVPFTRNLIVSSIADYGCDEKASFNNYYIWTQCWHIIVMLFRWDFEIHFIR